MRPLVLRLRCSLALRLAGTVLKLMALRDELTARGLGYLLKSWTCPTSNPAEWHARALAPRDALSHCCFFCTPARYRSMLALT
jgi:hypothetical protein